MKRRTRFFLHAMLPPLFGGVLIFLLMFITRSGPIDWASALPALGYVLIAAYVIAIIPSLAYAALMEWAFHRGMVEGSRRAVKLSALLGTAVGSIPLVIELFNPHQTIRLEDWAIGAAPSAVGCVVGVLVEVLVARHAHRKVAR
jgi:hypothetical protein